MKSARIITTAVLALLAAASGAAAQTTKQSTTKAKAATTAQTTQDRSAAAAQTTQKAKDCPRANYPGDPVCAWEDDGRDLPTPSRHAVRRELSGDVLIDDDISVGAADPKAMAKPPVAMNTPNPNPRKQPMGGGATVNYRF